jgi:hypothetical protein
MQLSKPQNLVLGLIIIIAILVIGYFRGKDYTGKIKTNMQMANAQVIKSSMAHRGGVVIDYIFYYDNIEYQNQETVGIYSGLREVFVNKSFPVVFSGTQPKFSQILLLPSDFEKYNLTYPDSLNWLKDLIQRSN